jgi:hypothetical protein
MNQPWEIEEAFATQIKVIIFLSHALNGGALTLFVGVVKVVAVVIFALLIIIIVVVVVVVITIVYFVVGAVVIVCVVIFVVYSMMPLLEPLNSC